MNFLRFLLLLSLAVWLGSLVFFAVVAQIAFATLPSSHWAGLMVRDSLVHLHAIGLGCGAVFLACSAIYNRAVLGRVGVLAANHIAVLTMLVLTTLSQFRIIPRMDVLRESVPGIALLAPDNPVRMQFDSLHVWSVRVETAVLVLGLMGLYSLAVRLSSARS
jgi:Domain of unknown function (DUF4149)